MQITHTHDDMTCVCVCLCSKRFFFSHYATHDEIILTIAAKNIDRTGSYRLMEQTKQKMKKHLSNKCVTKYTNYHHHHHHHYYW